MDSYIRPLIYEDTQRSYSLSIESNSCEQLKALNCPSFLHVDILHMTYSIHRNINNSYFPFFKIHIIKPILVSSCSQLPIQLPSEGISQCGQSDIDPRIKSRLTSDVHKGLLLTSYVDMIRRTWYFMFHVRFENGLHA